MKQEGQKLQDRLLGELASRFPGSIPTIIDISEKNFRYQLEKNDNYLFYLVDYNIDPSGNLNIDWKNAEPFML